MTVAVARDVTEAQSVVVGSSGIGCVVTVADGVDGRVVVLETPGHESAFSSVHINC